MALGLLVGPTAGLVATLVLTRQARPFREWLDAATYRFLGWIRGGSEYVASGTMLLAFVPLLLGGMFLGVLVVVGQASKRGTLQVCGTRVLASARFHVSRHIVESLSLSLSLDM